MDCLPEIYPSLIDIWPQSLASFGDWPSTQYCPNKLHLATGFKFGWEPPQGKAAWWIKGNDDTGGNGFWLYCNGIDDNPASISYAIGGTGEWSKQFKTDSCEKGDYLFGIQINSEEYQHKGDDTTLNNVRLWCKNHITGTEYRLAEPNAHMWGQWTERVNCPKYYGMAGIKLQIEAPEKNNDDTSLGRVVPYCKPIITFANVRVYKSP